MQVLGITGGSNVGKTFISSLFNNPNYLRMLGVSQRQTAIFNADDTLAKLYSSNSDVIGKIYSICPESVVNGKVETKKLAPFYFASDENAKKVDASSLDEIRQEASRFILSNAQKKLGLFDVPMLIESGLHEKCDFCLMVTADYDVREKRSIQRMGKQKGYDEQTSLDLFVDILKKQSGLGVKEREHITAREAAQIAEKCKRDALNQAGVPFFELDNSGEKSVEEMILDIKQNALSPMFNEKLPNCIG